MNAYRNAAHSALTCLFALGLLSTSYPTSQTGVASSSAGFQPLNIHAPSKMPDIGSLPLVFIPNAGQTDAAVRFQSHALGGTLFFTPGEVVMALPQNEHQPHATNRQARIDESNLPAALALSTVRLRFNNANPLTEMSGGEQLPGVVNYAVGEQPQWRTNIPTYSGIVYHKLYPGIDLRYDGTGGQLEGTFAVAPGADPSRIRWGYTGAAKLEIDPISGDLAITLPHEVLGSRRQIPLIEHAPIAWQIIDGRRISVEARFALGSASVAPTVGFAIGRYDPRYPLTIDPTISYSTYIGGSDWDDAFSITTDGVGNTYITGETLSSNFPQIGGHSSFGSYDAFVTKLDPSGSTLLYSTYFGSNANDEGFDISVDSSQNAYITGWTEPLNGGKSRALVAKLSQTGSQIYFYYLDLKGLNNSDDRGFSITVNDAGNAYVTGRTTLGTVANYNVFVAKLTADGSHYNVFWFGGAGVDEGHGIALDNSGNIYVTGYTDSSNLAILNPLQPTFGGSSDAFVAKVNPTLDAFVYSTYLGGDGDDSGWGIAVDGTGNVYVAGETASSNFPLQAPLQTALGGTRDAFVSKLNSDGTALIYSTYLGGSSDDSGFDLALDSDGNVYLAGQTNSIDFPTVNPTQPGFAGGASDGFVSKLDPQGAALTFSTYIGGSLEDGANALAYDGKGNIFVTGYTSSANFPSQSPVQPAFGGGADDAFITKINIGIGKYTISGQILDPKGNPIAGVSIAAGPAGNAITGVDGSFSFTNLSAGSYTLVPSKLGYNFTPPSANITVPPNVTSQRFTATALASGLTFVPLMVRSAPPPCDSFEPNDDRRANPSGPLASGQEYQARICSGDEEDNYVFTTTTSNPVQISLALPGTLAGNTVLLLYNAQTDMRQYLPKCGGLPVSGTSYTGTCQIPGPGRYIIRIYNEKQKDNTSFYTLRVIYQ
jgi:hypothetical protein